jgi:hypothetical protein
VLRLPMNWLSYRQNVGARLILSLSKPSCFARGIASAHSLASEELRIYWPKVARLNRPRTKE